MPLRGRAMVLCASPLIVRLGIRSVALFGGDTLYRTLPVKKGWHPTVSDVISPKNSINAIPLKMRCTVPQRGGEAHPLPSQYARGPETGRGLALRVGGGWVSGLSVALATRPGRDWKGHRENPPPTHPSRSPVWRTVLPNDYRALDYPCLECAPAQCCVSHIS